MGANQTLIQRLFSHKQLMGDRRGDRSKVLEISAQVCDQCQRKQSCLPYNFAQFDHKIQQMLEQLTHCDKRVLDAKAP